MGFYNIDFIWFEIISFNYFGDSKEIVQFLLECNNTIFKN